MQLKLFIFDFSNLRFNSKKIVLMTDFSSEFTDDQVNQIILGIKNNGIDLSVM